MSLKDKAALTGIGETAYVRGTPKTGPALQFEAALKAIADAGLTPKDIDGIIPIGITGNTAEEFIANFGIDDLRLRSFRMVAPAVSRPCRLPPPQSPQASASMCWWRSDAT